MRALALYLEATSNRVDRALARPEFAADHIAMLRARVQSGRDHARDALDDPLSVIYLIARAHGRATDDEQAHAVGSFVFLYLLSIDLFDDVQDDDLAGTPHEAVSPALAINDAITLAFLALDELRAAMDLEADPARRGAFLELFNRISLAAVAGQHRDLRGKVGATTPREVLATHQAKTSSMQLLTECGALLGRCDSQARSRYRRLGKSLAQFIQVRDDLRDIFGKELSVDLRTGKISYPVACLLEQGDGQTVECFHTLVDQLPDSMTALRKLLYDSGAVDASAQALEALRATLHEEVAAVSDDAPTLRTLLDVVDGLAQTVYEVEPIAATAKFWLPATPWHRRVRAAQQLFVERATPLGFRTPPRLVPWHLPHWMFVPERGAVFYPDLDGLPEETLPFQAQLLDTSDLEQVRQLMIDQLPAVMAHEMFHAWRHQAGRLTRDHWHEEWAANRLAVAYLRRFEPEVLDESHRLALEVTTRFAEVVATKDSVLERCHLESGSTGDGYGMTMVPTAVVGLELIRRLIRDAPELEPTVTELVGRPQAQALTG